MERVLFISCHRVRATRKTIATIIVITPLKVVIAAVEVPVVTVILDNHLVVCSSNSNIVIAVTLV